MKMTRRIAFQNMKYYKSKNILIGIAVFLTTVMLFLVPTIGKDMIDAQFAAINELYPSFHGMFRNVDSKTVEKLSVYHGIKVWGVRSDAASVETQNAQFLMMYLDKTGYLLNNQKLSEGKMPTKENEIAISKGGLLALNGQAKIGESITIPYQVYENGEMGYVKTGQFVVTGFLESENESSKVSLYPVFVSEKFLNREIPKEEQVYRFFFQLETNEKDSTKEIKERIYEIGNLFSIPENDIKTNDDYIMANYVDPVMVPTIVIIMCIIVFAGVITIYSIYYVGISQRVREFGKLKAMGASKAQLKQMVLWEGISVALIAVPIGLLSGTFLTKAVVSMIFYLYKEENIIMSTVSELISAGKIPLYHPSLYLIAFFVSFLTVRLGLQKPIRVVSKISEMEAIRYQGEEAQPSKHSKSKGKRKSKKEISLLGLSYIYLLGKKKNTLITIASMSITGIFVMVVATVLSCANPKESADSSILGQYEMTNVVEFNDKEHPERKWENIVKDNPLTEELKADIMKVEGIRDVVCFTGNYVTSDFFEGEDVYGITGVPEPYMKQLLDKVVEGNVSYEELQSGEVCIVDKTMLHWYPDIQAGSTLNLRLMDGGNREVRIKVGAIGDYDLGFTNFGFLLMGKEGLDKISLGNNNDRFVILADKNYDEETKEALSNLAKEHNLSDLHSWKQEYDQWKDGIALTAGAAYAFLGILGMICVMNMVNTMIHSVHLRKREIGMMQAMGMGNSQLIRMLLGEGLFYTAGTFVLSTAVGSLLGYPIFLVTKAEGWFNMSRYHYPFGMAVVVFFVLLAVQMFLAVMLGRSVKKESLIERIRYSE